jgi:hypothetical protein
MADSIDSITVGCAVPNSVLCLDALKCIMPPGAGSVPGQSCYDVLSATASSCYCGTSGSNCTTVGAANGVCLAQEENGLNSTNPSQIPLSFGDTNLPAGIANKLALCLDQNCGCFP